MNIASIGCGNMAAAILQRWLEVGAISPHQLRACTARPQSADAVRASLGIACGTSPAIAVDADVVLLAFKPQQRSSALASLRDVGASGPRPLWVSILAGVRLQELQEALGPDARVVRWMPNTPVRTGQGVIGCCFGDATTASDRQLTASLAAHLGTLVEVPEGQLDALTAISGCGPAYLFRFCEALQQAACDVGLEPATAAVLARATVVGAAQLLRQSEASAAALRAQVTSKGGMTAAALDHLEASHWDRTLSAAVQAACAQGAVLAGSPTNDR